MCMIKDNVFSGLATPFVASASMMPESDAASHRYSVPLGQWAVCLFLSGMRISNHY
jgi:hypothetical protein